MTEPDGMYGEEIRRALSAVADLVVPDGDGLDKIQQRTRHRSPAFAWFIAYATYLPHALIRAIRVPGSELILMAKGESTVFKRLWGTRRKLIAQARSPQAWLRPAIAAAGALVMVAAIVLAVPRLHQSIIPASSSNSNSGNSAPGHNGGPGGGGENVGSHSRLGTDAHNSEGATSPTSSSSNCPGPGSVNAGGENSSPPTVNSPSATMSVANQARNDKAPATHCSSASPSSGSSSSSSPGSSTPPGTTPPPTGVGTPTPTPPISPSGGGTPSPTTSVVNGTPSPGVTGTDGS